MRTANGRVFTVGRAVPGFTKFPSTLVTLFPATDCYVLASPGPTFFAGAKNGQRVRHFSSQHAQDTMFGAHAADGEVQV
jgi:hypothetical protein